MIDKSFIDIRFTIDIIDCIESIVETFIHSYLIPLPFMGATVSCQSFIHLSLFIDLC
jgi:hypothetical protein